jgi:hypothetical protein
MLSCGSGGLGMTDPQNEQQRTAASRRLADTLKRHGVAPRRPVPVAFILAVGLALGLIVGWLMWGR